MIEDSLIKKLIVSLKCDVCGQGYETDNINVIGHEDDLWFLMVFCSACRTQCLMAAVIKEDRAPEIITDLTTAELDKFKDVTALTVNEVLDMHNLLTDFDGDFSRLFSQEQT